MEKRSSVTLKPCPFCGVDCITYGYVRDGQSLGCGSCGVKLVRYHSRADDTNARLATAWNTRALPQVKLLVWHYALDLSELIAVSAFGQYAVWDDEDPRWAFSQRGAYKYFYVANFKEAKAAAQADYNKRVLGELVKEEENL